MRGKRQANEQRRTSLQSPPVPSGRRIHLFRIHRWQASGLPHYEPCRRTQSHPSPKSRCCRLVEEMTEITIKERLARMEERQVQLCSMVEKSLSNFADLSNRVSVLEALKHKALGMIAVVGAIMTVSWEVIKEMLVRKG